MNLQEAYVEQVYKAEIREGRNCTSIRTYFEGDER